VNRSAEFAGFTNWLDLYPAFLDAQGKQDPRLFVDGLHPREAGYRVWRDRLIQAKAAARTSATDSFSARSSALRQARHLFEVDAAAFGIGPSSVSALRWAIR
jgi:hypothetical protein